MKTRNSHGLLQLGREALAYCQCASALISGNKALFASVDLIGEKNQVILELYLSNTEIRLFEGSSGGRVVKLLACGARGPGFDSRPRHLNFQRLVISCFQVEIWLKDR